MSGISANPAVEKIVQKIVDTTSIEGDTQELLACLMAAYEAGRQANGTHVLVTGSPADGFAFIGPVTPNDPNLEYYTDVDPRPDYWWYAELTPLPIQSNADDDRTRIQILTITHPDTGTETTVFIDGKRVDDAEVVDIDPGRGYESADYERRIAGAQATAESPSATDFDQAVCEALESARDQFAKWAVD